MHKNTVMGNRQVFPKIFSSVKILKTGNKLLCSCNEYYTGATNTRLQRVIYVCWFNLAMYVRQSKSLCT